MVSNTLVQVPYRIYFGREVACTDRSIIYKYGLPHRKYLGPTSMDTEMAFIMCNQGQVHNAASACTLTPGVCYTLNQSGPSSSEWPSQSYALTTNFNQSSIHFSPSGLKTVYVECNHLRYLNLSELYPPMHAEVPHLHWSSRTNDASTSFVGKER